MNIAFTYPWVLALLPVILVCFVVRFLYRSAIAKRQTSIGATTPHLTRSFHPAMTGLRQCFLWSGCALLIVTVAGPRWGQGESTRAARGSNIVFAIDCSRSMLADDMYPNRMEVARRKALELMRATPEHRVALMPFARIATLRCPLTGDQQAIEDMLQDCSPDLFPADAGLQGTAIGNTVLESISLLDRHSDRGLAILVLSDGSDTDEERIQEAAQKAQERGIRIYGLFLGDADRTVSMLIDGRERIMNAEKSSLDILAETTGGISVNAMPDNTDMQTIGTHITNNNKQTEWEEKRRLIQLERFQFPLIGAFIFFALGFLLPLRRKG